MEELLARLRALLRRAAGNASSELSCGGITLKPETQQVLRDDQLIEVTAFEYRMLEYLMRHADEAVSKSRLADYLYPHDDDRDSNVIEVLIGRLRKNSTRMAHLRPLPPCVTGATVSRSVTRWVINPLINPAAE